MCKIHLAPWKILMFPHSSPPQANLTRIPCCWRVWTSSLRCWKRSSSSATMAYRWRPHTYGAQVSPWQGEYLEWYSTWANRVLPHMGQRQGMARSDRSTRSGWTNTIRETGKMSAAAAAAAATLTFLLVWCLFVAGESLVSESVTSQSVAITRQN